MNATRIGSADINQQDIGDLRLYSQWTTSLERGEVIHTVSVPGITIEPNRVLYWDNDPRRLNSIKRFSYILGIRAVAELDSLASYTESLRQSTELEGEQPTEKRLGTLAMLAERYRNKAIQGIHATREATSTARILFFYEPPKEKTKLLALHDHLLDISGRLFSPDEL